MTHKPSWFKEGQVLCSSAPTCGINKDGLDQFTVDDLTGVRSIDEIDDALAADVQAALTGRSTSTLTYNPLEDIEKKWIAVPRYFDRSADEAFDQYLEKALPGWSSSSLGELIDDGLLLRRDGHGSPSLDQRIGKVPYIKVSDIRAGLVNLNPTNMVPIALAESMWRGDSSGFEPFDLLSPERASKNIGDFAMLMPGQEQIVLTREVIVLRVLSPANFDPFFLAWALSLSVVRRQWDRVIFMQTNREDVGHRYREIRIPVPPDSKSAKKVSAPFRKFYKGLAEVRTEFGQWLAENGDHHFFLTSD